MYVNYLNSGKGQFEGEIYDITTPMTSNGYSMYLFASNYNRVYGPAYCKMYSAKITEGTEVVRDFVPCINDLGEIGMYDLVEGIFYGNKGTGTFYSGSPKGQEDIIEEVEYIESTGSQYIDTGYIANSNTKVEITLQDQDINFYENYFGGSKFRFLRNSTNVNTYIVNPEYGRNSINVDFTSKITLTYSNLGVWDNNKNIYANSLSMSTDTKQMLIFASYNGNNFDRYGNFMLYRFKIFEGEKLVRDFVPCRLNYTRYGLYDKVEGKFYGNLGTGEFTGGPVVK